MFKQESKQTRQRSGRNFRKPRCRNVRKQTKKTQRKSGQDRVIKQLLASGEIIHKNRETGKSTKSSYIWIFCNDWKMLGNRNRAVNSKLWFWDWTITKKNKTIIKTTPDKAWLIIKNSYVHSFTFAIEAFRLLYWHP